MTTLTAPAAVPVFPLSMFGPVHLGIDENGEHVYVDLAERNVLLGGEPGGGKSNALSLIVAHGALSGDCKLVLVDGKRVELGFWQHCADKFIGPSLADAIDCGKWLQQLMNDRYDQLLAAGLRKISRDSGEHIYLVVIDEYAYFSATVGTKTQQVEFSALTRDLVARGRAAGVRATPPPASTPSPAACPGCCPKPAPPAASRPPTSPTPISSTWRPTPRSSAERTPHEPR